LGGLGGRWVTSGRVEEREERPVAHGLARHPGATLAAALGKAAKGALVLVSTRLALSFASSPRRRPPVRHFFSPPIHFLCLLGSLLAWTAPISLASGPLSDLLRSRQLLQQRYDTSPNTSPSPLNTRLSTSRRVHPPHPPPSPQALSRAHTKPLARSRSPSAPHRPPQKQPHTASTSRTSFPG
jgi:hypothetical protein